MEAMILAAGLGTRLRPLTYETPKALIEVGGTPMLERVARRLIDAGADRLIVNVHAHRNKIRDFIREKDGFGVQVEVSEEPDQRLETGGGLKNATSFFRREGAFFMHNADILTDLSLRALQIVHEDADNALATLAVRPAEDDRYLLFDENDHLCGFSERETGEEVLRREPEGETRKLDFCGVQIIEPRIFDLMTETGVFSIINTYVRLAEEDETISAFHADAAEWMDIGTPERLEAARERAERGDFR
jgi:NDP-sugar pyrophosphorylase family protein